VTVFEKHDRIGGLLRYGIPDFKMEKHLIDRRIEQMTEEGVNFQTNVEVGKDGVTIASLLQSHDAVALTGGAEWPRDLPVPGRELDGVHFAMDYLIQQNKRGAGDDEMRAAPIGTITAKDKHVVVIGGGDTGSDCIGTAFRQGAASVTQLEILPRPPDHENKALTWPDWPLKLRTSHAHEEGAARDWAVTTKRAVGSDGCVEALECARIEWTPGTDGRSRMQEVAGGDFHLPAQLVLLAMGFLGPRRPGMLEHAGLTLDARGNVATNTADYRTSMDRVFAAGDMRRGQSLVVWAIREGRQCARAIDAFLTGTSLLPA
jgi:glutamate synthase (NADPH/NADH) small chain